MEKYNFKPTCLLWGFPGHGKSAFINSVCGDSVSQEGTTGEPCTMKPEIYKISKNEKIESFDSLTLLDTRGVNDTTNIKKSETMLNLIDFLLLHLEEEIINKFDCLIIFHNAGEQKTDHIFKNIAEFNASFKTKLEPKNIVVVLTFCSEFTPKKILEKKKYFESQLKGFRYVLWDSKKPQENQFKILCDFIKDSAPFKIEVVDNLQAQIILEAKHLRKNDQVAVITEDGNEIEVYDEDKKKINSIIEDKIITVEHIEETSGYGIWTILSLGISKLCEREEVKWFTMEHKFKEKSEDHKIEVISIELLHSDGISDYEHEYKVEGNTISLRSTLKFRSTVFGQYSAKYAIKYRASSKIIDMGLKEGQKLEYRPRNFKFDEYVPEARTRILVPFFNMQKEELNKVLS